MKAFLVFFFLVGFNQEVSSALRSERHVSHELEEVQGSKASNVRKLDICDENIILNSDGNSASGPLDLWQAARCTLASVNEGYLPGSKAFKVSERVDVNAGPLQAFSAEQLNCLTVGTNMTISLRLKLEDENGNAFACHGATWNVPTTCPIVSFWVEPFSGPSPWTNYWNEANLEESGGWQADEWNEFTSTFPVTSDMATATSMFFTIRGPATNISVYMSDPMLTFAIPSSAPTIDSNAVSPTSPTIPASTPPPPTLSPTPSRTPSSPSGGNAGNGPSQPGSQQPPREFLLRKRSRIKTRSNRPIPR